MFYGALKRKLYARGNINLYYFGTPLQDNGATDDLLAIYYNEFGAFSEWELDRLQVTEISVDESGNVTIMLED